MLPEQRGAAPVTHDLAVYDHQRYVKAGTQVAVKQQQNPGREQHSKGQQAENRGDEPCPDGQRHAHQSHAFGAQVQGGCNKVQRAHQGSDAEDGDACNPQVCAQLLTRSGIGKRAQRCVSCPAVQGSPAAHEEGGNQDHKCHKSRPERQHVQDGKRHVGRADLNRQKVISETALRRGGEHEEHHDGAVHGEQTEIGFRLDLADERQLRGRPDQVDAHQQGQKHAGEHRDQRQKVVLKADYLVVQAENVFPDKALGGGVRVYKVGASHGYCFAASRSASHLSKSAWLTTFTMPCIL